MLAPRGGMSAKTLDLSKYILASLGLKHTDVYNLLEKGDYASLVSIESNSFVNNPPLYFAAEFLSKFPFDVGIDRANVAMIKFSSVEDLLAASDSHLKHLLSRDGYKTEPAFHWIFHSAKRKIESCLGPFDWSLCEKYFGFGPGAAFDVKRRVAQVPNKYGNLKPSVTPLCLDLAIAAVCSNSVWRDFHTSVNGQDPEQWFNIVPGNKVVTVPKNSKTDRVIAIEPLMNMYIQKGIGGMIRKRLLRVGVDLNNQTLNQRLAYEASLDGSLATIDLSSASDSVSLYLCEEILPTDWTTAIKLCRSPLGVLPDGSTKYYRKVSSMGNGFTFELESLIFWAFCSSVTEYMELSDRRLGVYGDDLIVPTEAAGLLCHVLNLVGFTPNSKKTHVTGLFRESCGKHFLSGCDVTPFYIRENIDSADRLILLANSIRAYALRSLGVGYGCASEFKDVWQSTVDSVPPRYRVFGPLFLNGQLNDGAIGVNFDERCPSTRRAANWVEGFYYKALHPRLRYHRHDHIGVLINHIDIHGRSPVREWSPLSDFSSERGFRVSFTLTPQWQDIGPWV